MVTRVSFVCRRRDVSVERFTDLWCGEHVEFARRLPGLRGYSVTVLREAGAERPPCDGIAMVQFDSVEAATRAFAVPELARGLRSTRDEFASGATAFFADQHVVVPSGVQGG